MTLRQRQMARPRRRTFMHGEDRQQFYVTVLFVGLIGLLVFFLVAAVGLAFYNENIRPVARVGDVEIGPGMVRERAALLRNRIQIEENQLTPAVIDGEIDATRAAQRRTELDNQRNELGVVSVEGLIDIIFQSQLAAEMGIDVTDEEVEARLADEVATLERRQVLAIFVEPQAADEDEGPTLLERRAALERAERARAELDAGRDFADVAREYSGDESAAAGGDLGVISRLAPVDDVWIDEVFSLPEGGTTPVIAGADGVYRIGRVVNIQPRSEEPGLRTTLLRDLSEQRYREFARYEIAADKLRDQVVADAMGAQVDQVRLAHIFIEGSGDTGDDDADEGEVRYSEIVYAPNGDIIEAPDLPADDPAWDEARRQAEETMTELRAIADEEELLERFAEIAREESDSLVSGEDGGEVDFITRGLLPVAVADALFDEEHAEGALIGPVRAEGGYYVLLFHEWRESAQVRLERVTEALAEPGADFAAIAAEYSDGEAADEGGELGWFTREMLNPVIAGQIFDLRAGEVSEAIELGDGHYFFQALERGERALDADQLTDVRENAFERWYAPRKDAAERDGVIVRADDIEGDVGPGFDDFDDLDDFDFDFDFDEDDDFGFDEE
jgi:parvulin-like peptidyl-prolyl isomerase